MDEKLLRTLQDPSFIPWRAQIWLSISTQALLEKSWVKPHEIDPLHPHLIDPTSERWKPLWVRLVEIKFLFRPPVARCVHARFLHSPKGDRKVDVGHLSFHTSPQPGEEEKGIFERRRGE